MVVFLSGYPRPHFSDFSWKRLYNHSKFYPYNSYQKRGQNTWSWGVRIYQEIDRTGLRRSQGFCTACFDWTSFVCTFWHQDNQIPWSCWHYTHLVRLSNHNSLSLIKQEIVSNYVQVLTDQLTIHQLVLFKINKLENFQPPIKRQYFQFLG